VIRESKITCFLADKKQKKEKTKEKFFASSMMFPLLIGNGKIIVFLPVGYCRVAEHFWFLNGL
jgi:hypothetical protein